MITKVSFQPLTNPSRNPHTKVVKRWIKIATWSAIASLILLTSLKKNKTRRKKSHKIGELLLVLQVLDTFEFVAFPCRGSFLPLLFPPSSLPKTLSYREKTWYLCKGRRILCTEYSREDFSGKVVLPADSFTSWFLLLCPS